MTTLRHESAAGRRDLIDRIRDRQSTRGTFINLGSALATEVCAMAGFDWLLVDLEHGAGGEEALLGQIHAASAHDVPVMVRTESADRIRAGRVLDLGAAGIMYPRLNSSTEADAAIRHLHYPPSGDRGVATYNRARQFGHDTRTTTSVNDSVLGIVQIETLDALAHVTEIAHTPGVDVVFVGPGDLSYALGLPGQYGEAAFRDALGQVVRAAEDARIIAGILANNLESAVSYERVGFRFVAVGSDSTLLSQSARTAATRCFR